MSSSIPLLSSSSYSSSADSSSCIHIKLHACGWRRFLNGISNRYDDAFPIELQNIITEEDFSRIMKSLHNKIISHWPCDTCYIFGIGCAPCTLGASLLLPGKCATLAERESVLFLEDISLNKKFFERNITFSFRKTFWTSWVEISVPMNLFRSISDSEEGCGLKKDARRFANLHS